jgi:DNA-directed RNA polymerase subunit M
LEFCPKCGKALSPSRQGSKVVMACRRCGYVKDAEEVKVVVRQVGGKATVKEAAAIVEPTDAPLPSTHDVICPVCGHNEAKWWTVQTRSADEPMTQFFRCVKCGHTWREYA